MMEETHDKKSGIVVFFGSHSKQSGLKAFKTVPRRWLYGVANIFYIFTSNYLEKIPILSDIYQLKPTPRCNLESNDCRLTVLFHVSYFQGVPCFS